MACHARQSAEDALKTLIGLTYDAAIDAAQWPAFLARLAERCHRSAHLYHEKPLDTGGRIFAMTALPARGRLHGR